MRLDSTTGDIGGDTDCAASVARVLRGHILIRLVDDDGGSDEVRIRPELLDEVTVTPVGAVTANCFRLSVLAVGLKGDDVAGTGLLELDADDGGVERNAAEHSHRERRVAKLITERVDAAHKVLVE